MNCSSIKNLDKPARKDKILWQKNLKKSQSTWYPTYKSKPRQFRIPTTK